MALCGACTVHLAGRQRIRVRLAFGRLHAQHFCHGGAYRRAGGPRQDGPIEYRLKLLTPDALKLRRVPTLPQEKSAWRHSVPPNHAVGIACADYLDTGIACAAEVSIEDNRPRIHRVTVSVDCGLPVNPFSIEAQCQGAIGFGLTQLVAGGAIG